MNDVRFPKVRLTDSQFLSVVRATICNKRKTDGSLEYSDEIKEMTKKILASKNKSEC